jgi:hypothetical protein
MMKNDIFRALGFLGSMLLALTGSSALWKAAKSYGTGSPEPFSKVLLGLGLIVLSYCGLRYLRDGYRGGAFSIVGALFLLMGIYGIAITIETFTTNKEAIYELTGAFIIVVGGGLLLKAGHDRHRRLVAQAAE